MKTIVALTVLLLCYFSNAHAQTDSEVSAIERRISELNPVDKGLAGGTISLMEERRSIENEIQRFDFIENTQGIFDKMLPEIERAKKDVTEAMPAIAVLDCKQDAGRAPKLTGTIEDTMFRLSRTLPPNIERSVPYAWSGAPWSNNGQKENAALCTAWKDFLGDAESQKKLAAYFDTLMQAAKVEQASVQKAAQSAAKLVKLLRERKGLIDSKLTAEQTKKTLSGDLWKIIAAIGVCCILAIGAVKLFGENIQLEWVASGQVIQLVTVIILLSVIMALGLAEIIKETTLGTLLGGIGGYVLAQGVGRAAAREVGRVKQQDAMTTEDPKQKTADAAAL